MNWKIVSPTFMTFIVLFTLQLKGLQTTVPDPCPHDITGTTVAEMCTESSAVEEEQETSDTVNSVVIRMKTQMNCTCRVFFENQDSPRTIRVKKYNSSINSCSVKNPCGLTIEMAFLNQTYQSIPPLECTQGSDQRNFNLVSDAALQFSSRVTNGVFEKGYCIQVIRESISGNFRQRLICTKFTTNELITTANTDYTNTKLNTYKSSIIPNTYEHTTERYIYDDSTRHYTSDDRTRRYTSDDSTMPQYENNTILKTDQPGKTATESRLYIYIIAGVCSGVAVLVLAIVIILTYRRKLSCRREANKIPRCQQNLAKLDIPDESEYDGLKENILYKSSDQQDFCDINYSTVNIQTGDTNYSKIDTEETGDPTNSIDFGSKKSDVNARPNIQNISIVNKSFEMNENGVKHTSTGNGEVYAVVVKHRTTPQSDCNKGESRTHEDLHVYAVVNKMGNVNEQIGQKS